MTVYPTPAGRQAARRLLAARGSPLTELVGTLEEDEQKALDGLLRKLLSRLYEQVGNAQHMCRLCDRTCCTSRSTCPVGEAERARQQGDEQEPGP